MPELPEVETVMSTLRYQIANTSITGIDILYSDIIECDCDEFKRALIGQHFNHFQRRGKYCVFGMDNGYLVVHLRMEGKFFIKTARDKIEKHEHVIFYLNDGRQLRYCDTRKFGRMNYYPYPYDLATLGNLGVEPFDERFSGQYLYDAIHASHKAIKTLLMDQHIVAGIGNIYSDEILYATCIHPLTKGCSITLDQCDAMVEAARQILYAAIQDGGTTVRTYTSSLGVTGKFQMNVRAYGKANTLCGRCHQTIQRIVVNGRSACFCPHCQPLKE